MRCRGYRLEGEAKTSTWLQLFVQRRFFVQFSRPFQPQYSVDRLREQP